MIRFEKKILIDKNEYDFIHRNLFYSRHGENYINYYYDTDMLDLDNLDITCCVCQKEGAFISEIKAYQPNSECIVENSAFAENKYDDSFFRNMNIEFQGELKTYRIKFKYKDCVLYLDKNKYLGYTDYEFKVEYNSDNEKEANYIIYNISKYLYFSGIIDSSKEFIKRTEYQKSKSKRFFHRKKILEMENKGDPNYVFRIG